MVMTNHPGLDKDVEAFSPLSAPNRNRKCHDMSSMSEQGEKGHLAKRPRIGERTLLACIHCKQRKLKVLFPLFYSITFMLSCRGRFV